MGKGGMIGSYLHSSWSKKNIEFISTSKSLEAQENNVLFLDLRDENFQLPRGLRFKSVVVCAGITSVEQCESNAELAYLVNVKNTIAVLDELASRADYLVFLSSSRVFSGEIRQPSVSEPPIPKTIYGSTKLEVEKWLQATHPRFGILRLSKVLCEEDGLLRNWHKRVANNESFEAFSDMYINPTSLADVLSATEAMIDNQKKGLTHFSNSGSMSYYEYAVEWCTNHGYDKELVVSVKRPEKFPKFCCLGS